MRLPTRLPGLNRGSPAPREGAPALSLLSQPDSMDQTGASRKRHMVRVFCLVAWGAVVAVELSIAVQHPSVVNIVVTACLVALFVLVNVQLVLVRWMGQRRWHRVTGRLMGSAYLSDEYSMPNRNYVLAELRREMPRARSLGHPFVIVQFSLEDIDGVVERRGTDFAGRGVNALVETLKRLTRTSDFLAHLGGPNFCVMLVECTFEQSWTFLRRIPGTLPVSDGHQMYDVTVTARVHQYDMEALYATDVLREMEESRALRRKDEPERMDFMAA
ncbi:MAG: diguanylate cyclase domain-containing protein [Tepidiformaceae bacterium]